MVTMRSPAGMQHDSALSNVVLPLPVPPATTTFLRASTAHSRKRRKCPSIEPKRSISCSVITRWVNLRMVTMGPSGASGGMTTCTRWPSGMRAFTIGDDSSTRLPSGPSTRSISARSWAWLENARSLRTRRPCRSKNTSPGPFTMISVMVGSASNGCNGPKPNTSSISCSDSLDRRKASAPCHTGSANAWRHAPKSSLRARAGSNAINAAMSSTDTNRRTSSFRRASVAVGA